MYTWPCYALQASGEGTVTPRRSPLDNAGGHLRPRWLAEPQEVARASPITLGLASSLRVDDASQVTQGLEPMVLSGPLGGHGTPAREGDLHLSLGTWDTARKPLWLQTSPREGGPMDDRSGGKGARSAAAGAPGCRGATGRVGQHSPAASPRGLTRPVLEPGAASRSFYRKLELHLPKFSISGSYALEEVLPLLGVRDLFSPQANLSGISAQQNLLVSRVSRPELLGGHGGSPAAPPRSESGCAERPCADRVQRTLPVTSGRRCLRGRGSARRRGRAQMRGAGACAWQTRDVRLQPRQTCVGGQSLGLAGLDSGSASSGIGG